MTDVGVGVDERLAKMQKRYERERKARLEAEQIAERGMRALYDSNVDLDRRIAERTKQLEEARATAEAASLIKSDLLQGLSHEMRTPMNGILGMLELLHVDISSPQHRLWIDTATGAAQGLNRTLARLIEAMALDESSSLISDVKVEEVLQQTVDHWTPQFLKAGKLVTTHFDLPPDLTIQVTDRACSRVIDELLLNALDHGVPGVVRLSAELDPGTAGADAALVIGVVDAGPGLSDERRADLMLPIFSRRTQATSTADGGGLQLGLLLVARAVSVMGGTWGLVAEGVGTRAWLRLPLSATV